MNEPLVSILMTSFNREKYIGEAIKSVLDSTYTNWELLIVDDVSTDHTMQIATDFALKDSRIRVFQNKKNLGDYPNRNQAAAYAKGKYLKYIDADDQIYPTGLKTIVDSMEKFPDAGWGLMSLPQDNDRPFPFLLSPAEVYRRHYFQKPVFHKAPLSAVIKKSIFDKAGGFLPVRHYGDYELWHRLALHYPVVLMQEGIVWWRGHAEQEASKRKSKPWVAIETVNAALSNIRNIDCPLTQQEKEEVIKKLKNFQKGKVIQQLKKGNIKMALRLYSIQSEKTNR